MRYEGSRSFYSDFEKLSTAQKEMFLEVVASFNEGANATVLNGRPSWRSSLRVKAVEAAPGVFEMTWSFSGPDGRATWEWITLTDSDGVRHPGIRWRRIGDQSS